jgi:hypothetical protein
MNGPSLSATYTGPWVPEDRWWVRLEQEPITDDVATVPATAHYLDAVFRIDACNKEQTAPEPPTEDVALAEAAGLDFVICQQDPDGSVEVTIKVIRSHQDEGYRLHVAGGAVLASKVIVEEFAKVYPLTSALELELEYPVVGAFAASWQPDMVTASGARPPVQRHGNTLYWPEEATGSLQTAYLTTYDQVTIRVDGVDGKPGSATVRVVFHGLASDLVPELPDPADLDHALCWHVQSALAANTAEVTCYKSITRVKRCNCSKEEVDSETQDEVVPCPQGAPEKCPGSHSRCMHLLGSETITEYVDCSGDSEIPGRPGQFYAVASREYYKKQCCEYPSFELPQCPEKTESYKGGKKISGGEAQYRTIYGDSVSFVPVTPKGGTCGEHITKQIIEAEDCCEDVPVLAWDETISAKVLVDVGIVAVSGGRGPFKWTLTGERFSFSPDVTQQTAVSAGPTVAVYLEDFACGYCTIMCVDDCDQEATGGVRSTEGHWRVLTDEELVAFPRNPSYAPDAIFSRPPITEPEPFDPNDPLPDTLPPNEITWQHGIAMKDLGLFRIYVYFEGLWAVDYSVDLVNETLEAYFEGSNTPSLSTKWIGGEVVVVDYINIYSPLIIDQALAWMDARLAEGLMVPGTVPEWNRHDTMYHTWYTTGLPFRDDPITTVYDPSVMYAGVRMGVDGYGYDANHPLVVTWSCD